MFSSWFPCHIVSHPFLEAQNNQKEMDVSPVPAISDVKDLNGHIDATYLCLVVLAPGSCYFGVGLRHAGLELSGPFRCKRADGLT